MVPGFFTINSFNQDIFVPAPPLIPADTQGEPVAVKGIGCVGESEPMFFPFFPDIQNGSFVYGIWKVSVKINGIPGASAIRALISPF
jgi:hypothetical protein